MNIATHTNYFTRGRWVFVFITATGMIINEREAPYLVLTGSIPITFTDFCALEHMEIDKIETLIKRWQRSYPVR